MTVAAYSARGFSSGVARDEPQNDDDRDRNADKPEQCGTHDVLEILSSENAHRAATVPGLRMSGLPNSVFKFARRKIAAAAHVKTVVLTHFLPGEDNQTDMSAFAAGEKKYFSRTVIAGSDLFEYDLP